MRYCKIERGGTFGRGIRQNLGERALKPLPDKGWIEVPQKGTKIRNVPPLLKDRDKPVLHNTKNWLRRLFFKQALMVGIAGANQLNSRPNSTVETGFRRTTLILVLGN